MLRSLIHFRRSHLAVLLSCAVASAVLAGALVVGDSVRGSLSGLTLERLGRIDVALTGGLFFREQLASLLATSEEVSGASAAMILQASAVTPGKQARASGVSLVGIDAGFADFFDGEGPELVPVAGAKFPSVVVNAALQRELDVVVGDEILMALSRPGEAPRGTLLGSTDTGDVVRQLRLTVVKVIADRGIGRFSLRPHQELPLVAFVGLDTLQEGLEQQGRANSLLVAKQGPTTGIDSLEAALSGQLGLEDLGLVLSVGEGWVTLEHRDHVISPVLEDQIRLWTAERGLRTLPVLTYIANQLKSEQGEVPYSAVTAVDADLDGFFGRLELVNGEAAPGLAADEVLISAWAAEDLGAELGTAIEVTYFEVGPQEVLFEKTRSFRLAGVVGLQGLGGDTALTPDFPGISEADDMGDWDPPFPVHLDRVRERDEAYWDEHRALPKAFFSEETGRELWATRFGRATALRLAPADGMSLDELAELVRERLPREVDARKLGFAFDPVKERGLAASAGATDFSGLFIGFSLFLIVSAALLVGLFFGLGIEQRSPEIGLLLAVGLPQGQVRRRFLAEGAVVAGLGSVLGTVGAVLYAGALLAALRNWWLAAVGTPFLELHVNLQSLLLGAVLAFAVAWLSIILTLRRLRRVSILSLLRGVTREGEPGRSPMKGDPGSSRGRRAARWFQASVGLALALFVAAWATGNTSSPILFFGIGASLLVAGLAFLAIRLASPRARLVGKAGGAILAMATRNASVNPGRSLLSATLVASATFVIVAVAANGFRYGDEVDELDSPAGGYTLVAESDVPIHLDLQDRDALFDLGFDRETSVALRESTVTRFRLLPGDDVSCLNLYQPESPRLLGVPQSQIVRGGFELQQVSEERENPWTLLDDDLGEVVPAFGDHESVLWILKLGLGKDLVIEDEFGEPLTLRFVGLLRKSLFQSEVLISEEAFLKHFPSRSGFGYFLIDPAPEVSDEALSAGLEKRLADYGLDVTGTEERLQRYQAVFNTYLATFQALGGLGLLLGTLGLAAVLLRNVVERRGELATLRALGFRRRSLGVLVIAENGVLLVVGVGVGTLAALVAVAPHVLAGHSVVPWLGLAGTLGTILAFGMLACAAAVRLALAAPLLPVLKAE